MFINSESFHCMKILAWIATGWDETKVRRNGQLFGQNQFKALKHKQNMKQNKSSYDSVSFYLNQ